MFNNNYKFPKYLAVAMVTLATMISLVGCGNSTSSNSNESRNEIWGQVDATEVDLNSKIPGYVTEMYFKEGASVTKGQVLAHVDARTLEAQKNQTVAQMNAAQAQVSQAKSNLELTSADLERYSKLYEAGAISKQAYDKANTARNVAQEAYNQAQASVNAYQEGVNQVQVNLDDADIKAPFDGIITAKYVDTGAMVSSGMPLYAIQSPLDNWVNFKIPETMLSKFKVGQKIKVVGRDSELQLEGTIIDISQKPDFATKRATSERGSATDIISFNVKVQLNSDRVRPGMRFKMVDFTLSEAN